MLLVIVLAALGTAAWWIFAARESQQVAPSPPHVAPVEEEAPAVSARPVAPEAPPPAPLSAEDERFAAQLMRAEVRSDLDGVEIDSATLALLARGDIAQAARALEPRAAGGDADANVLLSLLQECSGTDSEFLLQLEGNEWRTAARDLPAERRAHVELALRARQQAVEAAARSCGEANFQRTAIAERLKSAAAAGHEASLRRLAEVTTDVEERVKLWTSAAMLGHLPAQLDLVQHYRRDTASAQRNAGRMKFWLDVAARDSSTGKLLLAECQAQGCNNLPPDPQSAARLVREAAATGDLEALERLLAEENLTSEERAGWSEFRDRLNEAGCYGASEYARISILTWRDRERAVSPYVQEQTRQIADRLWGQNSAHARRALKCE